MLSFAVDGKPELVIGLVNNMPARALRRVTAQFATLLDGDIRVRLRCFASRVDDEPGYEPVAALWNADLHGLIVTGVEPQARDVPDEPLWPLLARLTDWAADNTHSTIWSCMATQAAVFRLSGLRRQRLSTKLAGIYRCTRAGYHPLNVDAPQQWLVPHSRYFDLVPDSLLTAGYNILASGPGMAIDGGADSFTIFAGRSLFLMLQGHPEYGADALFLEHRRDIRRFLAGKTDHWPRPLDCYFDPSTAASLAALSSQAAGQSPEAVLAAVDALAGAIPAPSWREQAVRLFSNWVAYLATQPAYSRETLPVGP